MSEAPQRLRLFVAVDVPHEVLDELAAVVDPKRSTIEGARWAPLENQHITLKFLGSVETSMLAGVTEACERASRAVAPTHIRVVGMGAFPNARRARVIWAGIEDDDGVLTKLAMGLDEALAPLGFDPEKRAFTPHLTLARLKAPGDVRGFIDEVSFGSAAVPVRELHLYRSHLSPKGARYEIVRTFVLEGATR